MTKEKHADDPERGSKQNMEKTVEAAPPCHMCNCPSFRGVQDHNGVWSNCLNHNSLGKICDHPLPSHY